jgi:hypothetical protein
MLNLPYEILQLVFPQINTARLINKQIKTAVDEQFNRINHYISHLEKLDYYDRVPLKTDFGQKYFFNEYAGLFYDFIMIYDILKERDVARAKKRVLYLFKAYKLNVYNYSLNNDYYCYECLYINAYKMGLYQKPFVQNRDYKTVNQFLYKLIGNYLNQL